MVSSRKNRENRKRDSQWSKIQKRKLRWIYTDMTCLTSIIDFLWKITFSNCVWIFAHHNIMPGLLLYSHFRTSVVRRESWESTMSIHRPILPSFLETHADRPKFRTNRAWEDFSWTGSGRPVNHNYLNKICSRYQVGNKFAWRPHSDQRRAMNCNMDYGKFRIFRKEFWYPVRESVISGSFICPEGVKSSQIFLW